MLDAIDRRAASSAQLRMVYGLARKLGMENDVLHARVLAATGKEHLKQLTCGECAQLIDGLTGKDTSNRRRYDRPLNRVSQEQINRILALARKIGWLENGYERINRFLHSQYGVEHLDWLPPDDAQRCIEALKGMAGRGYSERTKKHETK